MLSDRQRRSIERNRRLHLALDTVGEWLFQALLLVLAWFILVFVFGGLGALPGYLLHSDMLAIVGGAAGCSVAGAVLASMMRGE
jgi:hypothetical protein